MNMEKAIKKTAICSYVCFCLVFVCSTTARGQHEWTIEQDVINRSLVSPGDTARLNHVMEKAKKGEKITFGVIGGSITQGASAGSAEQSYAALIAQWWRRKFGDNNVDYVNAGIGATGSDYAAFRVQSHLLNKEPDFVIVEFSVNDGNTKRGGETMEGLVRQILKQPNCPAVALLFMMHQGGINAQEWHGKIGSHYKLGMVSFRDAVWPEIEAGRIEWEEVMSDAVHPNDAGHYYAAQFMINYLEKVYDEVDSESLSCEITKTPPPFLTDVFEFTRLYTSAETRPVSNEGWTFEKGNWLGDWWRSDRPGSRIAFEVQGKYIAALFLCEKGDFGRVRISVDGRPCGILEGWGPQTWGGYMIVKMVAEDIPEGKHTVEITLLDEKNEQSNGHEFRIFAIAAAGNLINTSTEQRNLKPRKECNPTP